MPCEHSFYWAVSALSLGPLTSALLYALPAGRPRYGRPRLRCEAIKAPSIIKQLVQRSAQVPVPCKRVTSMCFALWCYV